MFPSRSELYLEDGTRLIDIVLVHKENSIRKQSDVATAVAAAATSTAAEGTTIVTPTSPSRAAAASRRAIFEANLVHQGLVLESFVHQVESL